MLEPMRILVVEDDKKIASFVVQGLKQSGFAVDQFGDGEEGLARARTVPYDAAIVDLSALTATNLPSGSWTALYTVESAPDPISSSTRQVPKRETTPRYSAGPCDERRRECPVIAAGWERPSSASIEGATSQIRPPGKSFAPTSRSFT